MSPEGSRFPPSLPSSPTTRSVGRLGDLREVSRKAWSKSADDLCKITTDHFSPAVHSFQEKIAEYRSRSDSNTSAVSPSSSTSAAHPTTVAGGRHPFPSLGSMPAPGCSPKNTSAPALSISISTPIIEEGSTPKLTASSGQGHVHIRSHSFTPKLPSKLSAPRFSPSPQRGGSHDRGFVLRNNEHGTPTRAAFGFGLSHKMPSQDSNIAGPPSLTTSNSQMMLLPPPTIIEPDQELHEEPESLDPRRTSQIVFCSGFINRLVDLPANFHQQTNLQLSKGWKPFKLELKGSKLYFYKPPNDRAAAIKELFPAYLVPPSEEDDQAHQTAEASTSTSGEKGDDLSSRSRATRQDLQTGMGRKKRAYWGRRTHPDLIKDDVTGKVKKGTIEALIHEAVFATTFFDSTSMTDDDEEQKGCHDDEEKQNLNWREFASSVLLSVPFIVTGGQQAFETEFVRCCSILVSGAVEDVREEAKLRVAWLANKYLRFHGRAADPEEWHELEQEVIPGFALSAPTADRSLSSPVASTSLQTLSHPSTSTDLGSVPSSSDVQTFSIRPDGKKMIPLLDALSSPPQQYPQHTNRQPARNGFGPSPSSKGLPWSILSEEGLTRNVLLQLDPHLIARSLSLFHRSILEKYPEKVSVEFVIASPGHVQNQQDQQRQESSSKEEALTHFYGSEDRPHWLTKLLLLQILGTESSGHHRTQSSGLVTSSSLAGVGPEDRHSSGAQTSRTHSRSDVISVWAKVGELCRTNGDECSWKAIAAGLCSRPIARLAKVWKRVDPQSVAAVERWALANGVLSSDGNKDEEAEAKVAVGQPQMTFWGGDVKARLNSELSKANEETMIVMEPLLRAAIIYEGFRTSFELCSRTVHVSEGEIDDDLRSLIAFWSELASEGGGKSGLALKFQRFFFLVNPLHNMLTMFISESINSCRSRL